MVPLVLLESPTPRSDNANFASGQCCMAISYHTCTLVHDPKSKEHSCNIFHRDLGKDFKSDGFLYVFWKTSLLWLWLLKTNQCCNPCRCHLTWFLQQSAMSCLLCRHNARVGEKVQWCGCRTHLNITSAARIVSNRSRPTKHPTDGIWPGSEASSIAKSLIGGRKTKGLHTC